jgi:hypothetical protein
MKTILVGFLVVSAAALIFYGAAFLIIEAVFRSAGL